MFVKVGCLGCKYHSSLKLSLSNYFLINIVVAHVSYSFALFVTKNKSGISCLRHQQALRRSTTPTLRSPSMMIPWWRLVARSSSVSRAATTSCIARERHLRARHHRCQPRQLGERVRVHPHRQLGHERRGDDVP